MQTGESLQEKYRIYAINFSKGFNDRENDTLMLVHVARPVSFKTFAWGFVLSHVELTVKSSGRKIPTIDIAGIQKISNDNKPMYEITADGDLLEIQ